MLQALRFLNTKRSNFKQVSSILPHFLILPALNRFFAQTLLETNQTHKDFSALNFPAIARNALSKCSNHCNTNKVNNFSNLSLKDHLLRLSSICPVIIRKFWRVDVLSAHNVFDILRECESYDIGIEKVESLWGMFNWASQKTREFQHLPNSCKIMASMLVRAGMFREVEFVLSRSESREILLDCQEIFSNLIEGYVGEFELERAVLVYERMRGLSLVPSVLSYRAIVKYLVESSDNIELMYRVYMDMLKLGIEWSEEEKIIHESVVRMLCINGKVQEARGLVKKAIGFGIKTSNVVIDALSFAYCEKKDYDDLLSFLNEAGTVPDLVVGNTILFSLCKNFGVEQASMYVQKLEELGFCPDEISFAILIGSSCYGGKLKDALVYFSEITSRGFKPCVYSYNALLSGMFKEGLWMHTRNILIEMNVTGIPVDLSTFRVLLAGFCKARKFDEVKALISQMEDHDFIKLLPHEDQLTKAFRLVGLDPLSVKIKRDNDKVLYRTEFFDNLGNGLYLDADINDYETKLGKILDGAMIPEFNSLVENSCVSDVKRALKEVDEMVKWGQKLLSPALSSLLSHLCGARCGINTINRLLEVTFVSIYHLDDKTLSMLVETYSRKGLQFRAYSLFEGMVRRGRAVDNSVFSALLLETCKKGDLKAFLHYYKIADKSNWSPEMKVYKVMINHLCKNKWLDEALELLETMMFLSPHNSIDIINSLFEELCTQGLISTTCVLLEECLDHVNYHHNICSLCLDKRFSKALIFLIPKLFKSNNVGKVVLLKDLCLNKQPLALVPSHCALIIGFCKSGRIEEAASMFKQVISDGHVPDNEVFNELIGCHCRAKKLMNVEELLGVMIRRNLSISISSFSNIARLICGEGRSSLAVSFKKLITQLTDLPEVVLNNILIFHLFATGNSLLAYGLIDDVQKKGPQPDAVTYNFLVQGSLQCNDFSRSHHYLTSMIHQDFRPSIRTLRKVINCLCCNGELDKALSLSQEMESRGWIHSSVTQSRIVEKLLSTGKLHEAVHFLDRIESKGLVPESINYNYLIKRFCAHGLLDKAAHLLNIMLRKGSPPDSTSYDYVIQGCCSHLDLESALNFHSEMLCRELKPCTKTWDVLVQKLCEGGRAGEAEELLGFMIGSGETPTRQMFYAVIDKYRAENNSSKASEILRMMQEKGYEPDFDTHWSVISDLTSSNKKGDGNPNRSFLSSLLSGFGFGRKNS